ncbi:MAG: hypothetical protein JXR96_23625 [Deltaproteobacteria bacterium]|nr:hypothetical protein [Deltaproteobacteria bacterium]
MPAQAEEGEEARRADPLTVLLALLLCALLALSMLACADYRSNYCTVDNRGQEICGGSPGPDGDCLPGSVRCEGSTVLFCDPDGESWTGFDCDAYCRETLGPEAYSLGCSADAEDPCQCRYDIIIGEMVECTPGDLRCLDDDTLQVCEDYWWATSRDCDDYCREMYGEWSFSRGCDSEAADPCQCEYDVTPGIVAMCTPGDLHCISERDVQVCNDDGISWTDMSCDEYCRETHGADYYSLGCDDEAREACQCEYGIIDGDMPSCTPGDFICQGEETILVCDQDAYSWTSWDCQDWCEEVYGEGWTSTGCDADEAENFCGCEYGIVDGEPIP